MEPTTGSLAGLAPDRPEELKAARLLRAIQNADFQTRKQAEREKLKTIVRTILEAADKTGELDEKVLATLPPMLADQLRASWAGRSGQGSGAAVAGRQMARPAYPQFRKYRAFQHLKKSRRRRPQDQDSGYGGKIGALAEPAVGSGD
jgi:hypothetical protein